MGGSGGCGCAPQGNIGANFLAPNTDRQACQAVLEDLLKGKELEDREVDRIVKAKSPLVAPNCARKLDAEPAI